MIGVAPADLAQRQLDAYNARDLDAFLACYTPDAVLTSDRGDVLVAATDFRSFYERRFDAWYPVELAGRLVAGDWVVDHEVGTPPAGELREIIIALHVAVDRIDRVVVFQS